MELPLEAYISIARNIGTKYELASLCQVSKRFMNAAERILYNTIHIRGVTEIQAICRVLADSSRLARWVDALSIDISNSDSDSAKSVPSTHEDDHWTLIARALQRTQRLRYLSIHIDDNTETNHAWVLDGCTFQLRTFHCDFAWDEHLVTFLNTQHSLADLYILDFQIGSGSPTVVTLGTRSLPKLSILECTFMEAANTLAANRCLTRLKTCFSSSDETGKKREVRALMTSLRRSRKHLRSLDIADSTYSSDFSLHLVDRVSQLFTSSSLRYLGTLTLPVEGPKVEYFMCRFPALNV